jgi:hypothetical protein
VGIKPTKPIPNKIFSKVKMKKKKKIYTTKIKILKN